MPLSTNRPANPRRPSLAPSFASEARRAEELAAATSDISIADPLLDIADQALEYNGSIPSMSGLFKQARAGLQIVPAATADRQRVASCVRLVFELAQIGWEAQGRPHQYAHSVAQAYRYHRTLTIDATALMMLRDTYPLVIRSLTGVPAVQRHAWLKTIQTRELLHLKGLSTYDWIK